MSNSADKDVLGGRGFHSSTHPLIHFSRPSRPLIHLYTSLSRPILLADIVILFTPSTSAHIPLQAEAWASVRPC